MVCITVKCPILAAMLDTVMNVMTKAYTCMVCFVIFVIMLIYVGVHKLSLFYCLCMYWNNCCHPFSHRAI